VLLGTFFSVFWRFRGSTGLAKGLGVTMGINPVGFFVAAPLGLVLIYITRNLAIGGSTVMVITALFSLAVFRDVLALVTIVIVGVLMFTRAKLQYRFMKKQTQGSASH
jgi:glycerol-3-phosphate acyltransferase PlsY